MRLPNGVKEALRAVRGLLNEEVYLVGGVVRDALLGKESEDLDLATRLPPEEVAARLGEAGLPLDLSGAVWGTVSTVLQVGGEVRKMEITTFRREVTYVGRHPVVRWAESLEEDLARRDFTVNAMALSPRGELMDPFGGRKDIERGLVRAVGEPEERFSEDPLRVVRALRFAARYGWAIEARTQEGMKKAAPLVVERVSMPRLGVEIEKGLMAPRPGRFLQGLHDLGLFYKVFPEFVGPWGAAHTLLQNPRHHPEGDVLSHTFQVVERARGLGADALGVWASLLHDVGKPATATPTPEGWYRFLGHEEAGAEMVEGIARRFGFSRAWEEAVRTAVRLHMRPLQPATPKAVRRFQAEAGEHLKLLEVVCRADGEGRREDLDPWFASLETPVSPLVRGRDLLALGFTPGPEMGRLLKEAYHLQLERGLSSKEEVLEALLREVEGRERELELG